MRKSEENSVFFFDYFLRIEERRVIFQNELLLLQLWILNFSIYVVAWEL
jgi:hypothetical protein